MVEYNGKQKIIKAKKEVILAAGTVGSAKLLMLSGVGPRSHLESLNVSFIENNVSTRIVYARMRGLFWCFFPELHSNEGNKHQNNTRVSA